MLLRRSFRRFAPVAVAAALLLGAGGPSAGAAADRAAGDEKARQEAHRALVEARKAQERRGRRGPVAAEVKGTVTAVAAAAKTFSLKVTQANQAALRGQTIRITLAPAGHVSVNNRPATLADAKVGDGAAVQGVTGADGKVTAYVVRLSRRAPVPARITGTVVTTDPLVLFAKGMNTPIQMATPSIVTLDDTAAAVADLRPGDTCTATAIPTSTGLVAFHLACIRP